MPTFLGNINLSKSEIQNARMQNLGSAPGTPVLGQMYFDTAGSVNLFKYWNGTAWIAAPRLDQIPAPTATVSMGSQLLSNVLDPVGAQDAATRGYVLGRRVSDLTAPNASFNMNSQKITGLATATTAGDATDFTFVTNAVENARQGLSLKTPVAAALGTNIVLTAPGATIDGVTMATNDRFLAYGQSTGAENGIYVWNGASSTATRAVDADVFGELQDGTQTWAMAGTVNANLQFRQTAALSSFTGQTWISIGTGTTYSWTAPLVNTAGTISISNAVPRQFAASFGDNSATSFVLTHNLNSQDIHCTVRDVSTRTEFLVDNAATSVNTATISGFLVAPTTNQYRAYITGFG